MHWASERTRRGQTVLGQFAAPDTPENCILPDADAQLIPTALARAA
jgi:hypothetical protein